MSNARPTATARTLRLSMEAEAAYGVLLAALVGHPGFRPGHLSTASPGGSIDLEMATDVQVIIDDRPGEPARLGEAAVTAYTTFGGVRVVVATDDLRAARAALG